ncbi:2OG-Fe(II) oxygenase [Komagataeibacter swingsii]|uniref:2OG-Fe(II) oxygenase n=1 Tax=Komagataeibacter swingsii TaxID=215220 RepID=A0A850P6W9_9PROT|nr:2OG-Fe(II) oxygenase [Komagataeibacter swingsii]NVN38773.1 2OG-Fe(II) oxygenase [Komagataeibacter swingsii]
MLLSLFSTGLRKSGESMPRIKMDIGDPVPPFTQKASTNSGICAFDTAGGRHILFFFFSKSTDPDVEQVLKEISYYKDALNRPDCMFFGVSLDAGDVIRLRKRPDLSSVCFLYDSDRKCHDLFGVPAGASPCWVEVDPMMHVSGHFPHAPGATDMAFKALMKRASQPKPSVPVPALILEHVLEPTFCKTLIHYHQSHNPYPSPILTADVAGNPLRMVVPHFKRRLDTPIREKKLTMDLQGRIIQRVVPEIFRVFRFKATQMDRMLISSYDARDQGFFNAHRDNTVPASAHRQFAVSINLNHDYQGGELVFPEFSDQAFRAPAGGAIIFSCALLHAVRPVTHGRRYAYLPFVY